MHTLLTKSGYELVPLETDRSRDDAAEKMVMAVVKHELDFEYL